MNTLFSPDFWIAHMLPSGVALAGFYLLYKGLVRNDNHLNIRRFVILGCLAFAMILPFLHFELPFSWGANRIEAISPVTMEFLIPNDFVVIDETAHNHVSWYEIIGWIYLTVVLFLVGRGFVGILHLAAFSRKGKRLPVENANIIVCTNIPTAFSFFNRIFIPKSWCDGDERDFVLRHELVHVKQKHSWDLMLMEFVCAVQFFNPFAWLLRHEMRLNHEFLADQGALEKGGDATQYFQLVLQKITGKQPALVHAFNYSSIKHRIMMQLTKPAKRLSQARYLAFVPLALALTLSFAVQGKTVTSEDVANLQNSADADLQPVSIQQGTDSKSTPAKLTNIEDTVRITGSINIPRDVAKLPKDILIIVDGNEFSGDVNSIPNETIQSVTVLKDAASLATYGKKGANGVVLIVTKSFAKDNDGSEKLNSEGPGDQIFTMVEEPPYFPGGEEARLKYLAENIRYPAEARDTNAQGTVYASFVIEKDGSLSNVKIEKGIGYGCDEEVVRVIKNMPKWIPGKQRGRVVRVSFMMPVRFSLK